ncbi:MAG: UPF0262 family protein [Hydrotalea sp.]|nr:UPF0262 family protein [Hydrotalea sp.]
MLTKKIKKPPSKKHAIKKDAAPSPSPSLKSVVIDAKLVAQHPRGLKRELETIAADLMQHGKLSLVGFEKPPYRLRISAHENQMILDFFSLRDKPIHLYLLSLRPLQRHFKDYQDIVLAHLDQAQKPSRHQMEAIDMARRGIHNDAAAVLIERLKGKIIIDIETARLFFSLLSLLFIPHVALMPDFSLLGGRGAAPPPNVGKPPPAQYLFCCTMNSVRSPMALSLARHLWQNKKSGLEKWQSAGVLATSDKISLDPFIPTVLKEKNIQSVTGTGKLLSAASLQEYDKIFALSSDALHFLQQQKIPASKIIYWHDIIDPTLVEGSREQKLVAYRALRDQLTKKLTTATVDL